MSIAVASVRGTMRTSALAGLLACAATRTPAAECAATRTPAAPPVLVATHEEAPRAVDAPTACSDAGTEAAFLVVDVQKPEWLAAPPVLWWDDGTFVEPKISMEGPRTPSA